MPPWDMHQIRDYVAKTENRDPRQQPDGEFTYIDVSSVDRRLYRITTPSILLGKDAPSRARKVVRAGDVIFATVRPTLRRVALITEEFDDQVCSTGYCVLRPNGALDSRFLYYWLLTDAVMRDVASVQRGANYPAVRDRDVKTLRIPIPSISEQRRIAALLSAVQLAMEQQQQLIARTSELKNALMGKLFSEGVRREVHRDSEIGPMPKSWDVVPLGDVLVVAQYGLSVKGNDVGRYPILRMTNQVNGRISPDNLQWAETGDDEFERFRVHRGDILFNRTNSFDLVGRTAIFDIEGDYIFASYLIRLRTDEKRLNPFFLNHYFNCPTTQLRLKTIATRAVSQSNISATRLKGFPIPLPPIDEQAEIVRTLDVLDNKIALHERGRDAFESLFSTLLHDVMAERVRATNLDLDALEGAEGPERQEVA